MYTRCSSDAIRGLWFFDTALAGRVTLFASHVGKVRCRLESNRNIDGLTERYVVTLEHRDADSVA